MTATAGDKHDPSEPPEIEAELIDAPSSGAPPAATLSPGPKKKSLWPLGVAATAVVAIAGGGYWGVNELLKGRAPPEAVAAASPDREPAVEVEPAHVPAHVETTTPGQAVASEPASDDGDSLAVQPPATEAAPSTPLPTGVAEAPATAPSDAAPVTPVAPSPTDALAELEALAEAAAARETDGLSAASTVAATPAPPDAMGVPPSGTTSGPFDDSSVVNELKALRAFFETETSRLATELDAEKSRADAQAQEIAALRASLAALSAPEEPAVVAPPLTEVPKIAAPTIAAPQPERATLVLFALARAVESGRPYKLELARAEALAPASPAIARLRVDAADGAPTLASLKSRFPAEVRRALAADAGKNGGLIGRFSSGAAELVSVRPAGPVKGARPAAVLSRAEAAFAADDVEAALGEMKALVGPAREAMAAFIADAERHVAARMSLTELNADLIENAAG